VDSIDPQHEAPGGADPSAALRRRLVLSMVAVAGVMAAAFAVLHLAGERPDLALFSLSAVVACGVLVAVLRLTRDHRPAVLVATAYASVVTLALLAWPSAPTGDLVWCFIVPPMLAYAGGRQIARWALPLYLGAAAVIVLLPGFARHDQWSELELEGRFLGALLLVGAVSYLYELARARSQAQLESEVRERRAAERELGLANARLLVAAEESARLAAQAQAANLAKTTFLSHMSHDIRTPLTGIVGMTSVLELGELSDEQRLCVDTIRVSGETLTELIGDILDLARIDAGRVQLRTDPFAPSQLLEGVQRVLAPLADAKGLTLLVDLHPDLPPRLRADPGRLRQILLNLGGNAVKFTERGRVCISLGPRPDGDPRWWRLEVQDSGIGIAPEQHRRVFESFTQVDLSSTRRQGGSGLGLAICSRLVALMGGELGLESVEGQGSRFWADLPLTPAAADDRVGREDLGPIPSLSPRRLLVVDDNEIVRQVLGGLLRFEGHAVEEAVDGVAALDRLALRRFDAVLMDVQMPGLDGLEATRRLRAGDGAVSDPRVPVVAITALADPDTRQACLDAGMDAVVTKPVNRESLLRALATVLG
jgi:signal transduction histidine kinase